MINLRYHIISLAAVLLALAAGIALGAGVLDESSTPMTTTGKSDVEISPALAGFDAGYAALTAPGLLDGKLKGRTVMLFTTPGARESEVNSIIENLTTAGASVSGQIAMTSKLLTASNRQFAVGVATQSNPQANAQQADDYALVGTAIGRAYLTSGNGAVDDTARTIRSAFVEGGLLDPEQDPETSAELAIIVSGTAGSGASGEGTVIANIAPAMDEAGDGLEVVGPVSSGESGVVAAVRGSDTAANVSTVDVTDTGTGRVAVVLGLISEASGTSGSWGTSRAADGPVPS